MNAKPFIISLILSATLFMAGTALAGPELTPEQLAKARETAAKLNPPVDFDAMLAEADRLGVECTGDLSRKVRIEICAGNVEIAQSKERQIKLDQEINTTEERLKKKVNDLSDKAEHKLN